jgi:Ca2+-binding RTX toxin-like protein
MSSESRSVELLEARRLLSSVELARGGVLRVVGDDNVDDSIVLSLSGDQVSVVLNGGEAQLFKQSDVRGIRAHGMSGNDTLTVNESGGALGVRVFANGGEGNDVFTGGAEADAFHGGAGDDQLNGGAGRNVLHGGDGNDGLAGGDDRDVIYAGGGDDDVAGNGGRDFLRGGAGNDTLRGNLGNDLMFGEAGDDVLHGDEDSDVLVGGGGNDLLDAGEGNNFLFALEGTDTLGAGAGNDRAFVSKGGGDTVDLGTGENTVREADVRSFVRNFRRIHLREIGFLLRHMFELR